MKNTLTFILLFFFNISIRSQTRIYVPRQYTTINEALLNASPGDSILVSGGLYEENILWPAKNNLTLKSLEGKENTRLEPLQDDSPILYIDTGVDSSTIIEGITFSNAKAGIRVIASSPTFDDIKIENCSDIGVFINESYADTRLILKNSLITNNIFGIKIRRNNVLIENCKFDSNQLGIDFSGQNFSLKNSEIINNGNKSDYETGGCWIYASKNIKIDFCLFKGNISDNIGGLNLLTSDVEITNSDFIENTGYRHAGAIGIVSSRASIINSTVRNNKCFTSVPGCAGIMLRGTSGTSTLSINNFRIINNFTNHYGVSNHQISSGIGSLGSCNIQNMSNGIIANNSLAMIQNWVEDHVYGIGLGFRYSARVENAENILFAENLPVYEGDIVFAGINANGNFNKITVSNHKTAFSLINSDEFNISNSNICLNTEIFKNVESSHNFNNNFWGTKEGPYHQVYNVNGSYPYLPLLVNPLPFFTEPVEDAPLIPVQNLSFNVENGNIIFNWDSSINREADHYKLFFSETQGYPYEDSLLVNIYDTNYVFSKNELIHDSTYFSVVLVNKNGRRSWYSSDVLVESNIILSNRKNEVDYHFNLLDNYPNPFNPNTTIGFSLKFPGNVNISVFNILGEKVSTLIDEYKNAGNYKVEFTAKNLPSGIYFYTINAGEFTETKKMILLR